MPKMSMLELAEEYGYDVSDSDMFDAVNTIREINQKWFRGKHIYREDKFRYYLLLRMVLEYCAEHASDPKKEFHMRERAKKCDRLALSYSYVRETY